MGRKHTKQRAWRVLCLPLLIAASEAEAARQGSLGPTSAGTISISASIAPHARITAPEDIAFDGTGKAANRLAQNLCLTSNSLTRSFVVSAIGSGDAGALELFDGHQTVGYTVEWASREDAIPGESGATKRELRAAASKTECDTGRGSTALVVAVDPAHFDEVHTGAPFTGTLTLIVAPE